MTVSSSIAQLRVNGTIVATVGGALSKTSTLASGQTANVLLPEILSITPAVANTIATAAAGTVTITRTFTDTETTGVGTLQVAAGNSAAGNLSVRRIELSFDNNSKTDVVRKGDRRQAVADVSYRSSGILKGEWRLADPSSSSGSNRYRVLKVVRQQLVGSGQGRARIYSPPLPTQKNGLYLVTFVVDTDDTSIQYPVLRYFVLEARKGETVENLTVQAPGNGVSITDKTVFSWPVVPGAIAYQIEILEKGTNELLAGKLVPSKDLKLSLEGFSISNLAPGKSYDWRLRAFAPKGNVIGVSPRRTLYMP